MEIVIKNRSIVENFRKSILEEVDKYLDKYLKELGVGESESAIAHKVVFQNFDITSEINFNYIALDSYLTKFINENHIRNFELSMIL